MSKNILLFTVIALGLVIVGVFIYSETLFGKKTIPSANQKPLNAQEKVEENETFKNVKKVTSIGASNTYTTTKTAGDIMIVPNSRIKVMGGLKINVSMDINATIASSGAGYLFTNSLPRNAENTFASAPSLYLFYFPEGKRWVIRTIIDGNTEYYPLLASDKEIAGNYMITISPDGKTIQIHNNGEYEKNIDLNGSLYSLTNDMASYIITSSGIQVSLVNLSYQY